MKRALAIALLALGLLPAGAQAASKGMVVTLAELNAPSIQDDLQQAGVSWVRLFAPLDTYLTAGKLNDYVLSHTFTATRAMHERGIKVGMVLTSNPSHLNSDPTAAPEPVAWTAEAVKVVTALRDLVDLWEIWNEPDADRFWKGADVSTGANAAQYAALLRVAYPALRAADPTSRVFVGGLTGQNWPYLEKLYAHGAGGFFDGVAVHPDTACNLKGPYSRMPQSGSKRASQWSFLGYREVYATMAAHGDGDKPIIMTEAGWSTKPGLCADGMWAGQKNAGVSEADQATYLLQMFRCLEETPYVESAWWYRLSDEITKDYADYFGLWKSDHSHKPAWEAYQKVGTDAGRLQEECGDFRPPTISLVSPTPGAKFAGPLLIQASASDPSGVPRLKFRYEGGSLGSVGATRQQILSGTSPTSLSRSLTWLRAKNLPLGKHLITIEALDDEGNVARQEVPVIKVTPDRLPKVRTKVKLRISGADRQGRRQVTAEMQPLGPVSWIGGRLRVSYQKRVARRGWVTAYKYGGSPRRPYMHLRFLARGSRWRVLVEYLPVAPLLGSRRISRSWRVS